MIRIQEGLSKRDFTMHDDVVRLKKPDNAEKQRKKGLFMASRGRINYAKN